MQNSEVSFQTTMSDKDFRCFKKWLKSHLAFGPTTVVFTKKDGTEREMLCTTRPDIVPYIEKAETKIQKKINEEVCNVYDVKAKGWRSFRWDSIKGVKFTLGD